MLRLVSGAWRRRTAVLVIAQIFAVAYTTQDRAEAKGRYNPPYAAIVIDANTDRVLYAHSADAARYPASLTKMMTLFMVFDALEAGKLTLGTRMKASGHAAAQAPSKVGIKPGETISVEDAIKVLVTKSANDVAVVVAEHLGGTVSGFAAAMTARARQIGMSHTTFRNPHGLPDDEQKTTARDMAMLAEALIRRHPKYYRFFATRSHSYRGKTYRNHNRLLGRVRGVDGIKTGYIRASGFNLTTSARRGNKHLIAVVMGGKSGRSRDAHMASLLARYFPKASTRLPLAAKLDEVPRPPARPATPVTVTYSQMPVLPPEPDSQDKRAPSPDVVKAGSVTLHSRSETIAAQQTTIILPAGTPPRVVPDAKVTDAITKLLNEQWLIQIGAFNDEPSAKARLAEARQEIGALGQMLAYTEPVRKDETTLWRARFSGFDKEAAQEACARLKKASFKCLPLRQ